MHIWNGKAVVIGLFIQLIEGKVTGIQVIPRPLVMLGESPTHLLGRLIFERKFPPEMYVRL